jgi:nucleotide-binding universal stress UspA family protein
MATIVVGVDGSEHSDVALAFAVQEAALHGAGLRIVCAWSLPSSMNMDSGIASVVFNSIREEAEIVADEAMEKAQALRSDVPCTAKVVEGHAVSVLLAEAGDAIQLVVGSRGRGGLAGMLLGSVSRHVILHSPCPVTVVPTPKQP